MNIETLKLINRRVRHWVYKGMDCGGRPVYVEFRKIHPNGIILSVGSDNHRNRLFDHCWYVDYNKMTEEDKVEIFHQLHEAMRGKGYDNIDFTKLNCYRFDGGDGWIIRYKGWNERVGKK